LEEENTMEIKRTFLRADFVWWLVLAFMASAFTFFSVPAHAQTDVPAIRIERMAVIPFFKGTHASATQESLNCPVYLLSPGGEPLEPEADQLLTGLVQKALEKRYGYRVVPLDNVLTAYRAIPKDEAKDTPLSLSQKTGKALEANVALVGFLGRFRERVGGSMGVESPASVAFHLNLIDVDSGKLLWKASFSETQRSLSENLLDAPTFFKRGAKWLTAGELARNGIDETLRKYPF
jgi:hypothetical protein